MPVDKADLIAELETAIHGDPDWKGAGKEKALTEINWSYTDVDGIAHMQSLGKAYGCHVCKRKVEDMENCQNWIADHQPPVNLPASAMSHYEEEGFEFDDDRSLFPQCVECSSMQSSLVRKIKTAKVGELPDLDDDDQQLLQGHKKRSRDGNSTNYIKTDPKRLKASKLESELIQKIGKQFGCHTCDAKKSVVKYEADHCPPTTLFQYTWARSIADHLGVKMGTFMIRPACPSCQRAQGGKTSTLLRRMATYYYQNKEDFRGKNIVISTAGYEPHNCR